MNATTTAEGDGPVVSRAARARNATAGFARRFGSVEWGLVLALGAATFVVHDVGYLLSRPYWTDEAWVAVTTRFPIGDLRDTTSSTPIGWSALLRLFAVGGAQRQRIEPLLFSAATVILAYWFAGGSAGAIAGWVSARACWLDSRRSLRQPCWCETT